MRRVLVFAFVLVAVLVACGAMGRFGRIVPNRANWVIVANFTGVYIHIPRDCGWLGCIGPDLRLMPWSRVSGADPSSFEYVGSTTEDGFVTDTGLDLFRDAHHVFYGLSDLGTTIVEGSHPARIEFHSGYATDGKYIYMDGRIFRNLDPATFEKLGSRLCHLWRDRTAVYCGFNGVYDPTPGVDAATFEIISEGKCTEDSPLRTRDKNGEYLLDFVHGFRRAPPEG